MLYIIEIAESQIALVWRPRVLHRMWSPRVNRQWCSSKKHRGYKLEGESIHQRVYDIATEGIPRFL